MKSDGRERATKNHGKDKKVCSILVKSGSTTLKYRYDCKRRVNWNTYGSTAISLSARILLGSVRTISDVTSNST